MKFTKGQWAKLNMRNLNLIIAVPAQGIAPDEAMPLEGTVRAINIDTIFKKLSLAFNTLKPRQNGRHFPADILICTFLNQNISISINVPLKFVPKGPINNIPALD